MFHPGERPRGNGEEGPNKKEILREMKRFCIYYKIKPFKVFDCKEGIYFVFPLKDQKMSQDEIWDSEGMSQIRDFFTKKGYNVGLRKFVFNESFWNNWMMGKEKIHLYIGQANLKSMFDLLNERQKEIDF
jgi:hypothetical protein